MKIILVIGAGPAGLTAAYELLKNHRDEYKVIILEESNEIGGISRTVFHNGNRMDIGGHRFFSKDKRVTDWWQELLPMQGAPSRDDLLTGREMQLAENGPDPENEDRVMLKRRRISRIYYQKKFFDYPIRLNAATLRNMGFMTTVAAGFSYLKSAIHKLPEDSLENFYINRFGRKLYSMFFESYTEKLWGRHPREISASWGAQRIKGLSIKAILKDILTKTTSRTKQDVKNVETSLIEEFSYPKYGPGQLWERVAACIESMGGEIRKNCRATGVTASEGKVSGVIYVKDGKSYRMNADVVISSMPVRDLIAGMNGVPKDIHRIAAGLPYRDFVTVGLLVDKLALKNETKLHTMSDILPDCWIYVQDAGIKLGRIQIFNNWSPYMVRDPEHTVWIGLEYFCREGDDFWNMTEQEWVQKGTDELIRMGVISDPSVVRDAHLERVKKAYPAYFDTYHQMDTVRSYLNSFDNLYCIGRNGQHRYNNMDHSMATAFEAVDNIVSARKDKSNVWNVNTEQAYHEEKQEKIS